MILSNGWVLPFSDMLDWSRAVVWADERNLAGIVSRLRKIPHRRVVEMSRVGTQFYADYFSSIEKIMQTTLKILESRIFSSVTQSNNVTLPVSSNPRQVFHISRQRCQLWLFCTSLSRFSGEFLAQLDFIDEILFVNCQNLNTTNRLFGSKSVKYANQSWLPDLISYFDLECVIMLRDDLISSELGIRLEQTFRVWQDNSDSLVGLDNGLAYKFSRDCFRIDSKLENGYSFVGLDATFVKKSRLTDLANQQQSRLWSQCDDSFFKCFMPILNLLTIRNNHSAILVRSENRTTKLVGDYYSLTCLDELFERVFGVDRTFFTKYILKNFFYFNLK